MSTFERVYSDEQRDAALSAYLDRGVRPQRRIVELAAAGELTHRGKPLEPFALNLNTLRDMLTVERKRRAGRVRGETAKMPHMDAVDALRARMLNVADTTLAAEEKIDPAKRDPERMRQIARLVREVAALPAKGEGRSRAPGQKENGAKQSGETTGGMGGALLSAARKRPAPERITHPSTQAENTGAAQPSEDGSEDATVAVPGPPERVSVLRSAPLTHA